MGYFCLRFCTLVFSFTRNNKDKVHCQSITYMLHDDLKFIYCNRLQYIYVCIKHVCTHLHVHSLDTSSNVFGYKVNYEDLCWNVYLDLYTSKPTDCIRGKQTYLPRSVPYKMPVAKNWAKWRIPMEWPNLWWFFFPYIHFSLLKSMNWLMSINLTQSAQR